MKPIDEAELSGLIDGELSPERAAEIQQALGNDPELRREYQRLADLDHVWQRAADQAPFRPSIQVPRLAPKATGLDPTWTQTMMALTVLSLLYLLPKFADLVVIGVGLHVCALGSVLWLVGKLRAESEVQHVAAP